MTNLLQAKEGIVELQAENVVLNRKLLLTKVILYPSILVLIGLGFINPIFYLFSLTFAVVLFFNIRYLNIEIKMNNFVILVTYSCIQGEFNTNFNPSKDSNIIDKELIG